MGLRDKLKKSVVFCDKLYITNREQRDLLSLSALLL